MFQVAGNQQSFEAALAREYPRIVGLCAHISGDTTAAEDLAQETFVEAWRNRHKLRTLDGLAPWLSAIARNVCLRWRSRRGSAASRLTILTDDSTSASKAMDQVATEDDVELELERADLAALLDQAMALLPPETRAVLIERYVAELPVAEIGMRLGMNAGAVKMRLRRGKVAVRRALNEELWSYASSFGLVDQDDGGWHETTIWCPICGQRRLEGFYDPVAGDLALRCPACYPSYALYQTQSYAMPAIFDGIDSLGDAYEHLIAMAGRYFRQALEEDAAECIHCRRPATVVRSFPPGSRLCTFDWLGVHVHCEFCDRTTSGSVSGMLLGLPELQAFRQQHPRLRTLPQRQIEVDGKRAVAVRFQSMTDSRARVVIVDRESFRILQVHDESGLPAIV